MKKILLFTLVALFSVSTIFASGASESTAVKSDEPVVLEWWTWDPDMKDRNQVLIAQFEAENPGVTINNTITSTKEYWTKIRILANQQKLPDVYTMSSGYVEEWAKAGLMLNLDSYINADDTKEVFYDSLLDTAKSISASDHYYALPFALVTTVLFYNKDAFDAANLTYPNDDWTWDQFRAAANKLTIDKDSDGKIDQWGFWFYGRYAHIEPWVFANNGNLINRDTMRFEPDSNALEALHMLTDLVLVDKAAPSQKEMSAVRQQDIFPQQMAAMWIDGSWNVDNNRNVADSDMNWGIAKVPMGPQATERITFGWPDSYSIAANTENPDLAWKFTKYVAGAGLSLDDYMVGKIPSYRALTESAEFVDPNQKPSEMKILTEQAAGKLQTSYTLEWGRWRGYGAAESLGMNGLIDGIINGELSFDEAIAKGTKSINAVLAHNYK